MTDAFRPNPYLDVPDRDVRTTGGVDLTMINPAYLTRLVGESLKVEEIHIHLTSLRPIRPANASDDWESVALAKFEKGNSVVHALTGSPGNRIFRYMESLKVEAECLSCHGKQGYKVGDIRGGISISFPYTPFEQSAASAERIAIIRHLVALGVMFLLLFFLGRRITGLLDGLQESWRKIRKLEGILPMCANCKKIRKEGMAQTDPGAWVPVDSYITDRSEARVSHGICPECMERLYGPGGSLREK